MTGDPFTRCYPKPLPTPPEPKRDPCNPSPCGLYAECRQVNGNPSCSCLSNYIGSPPNCRPECVVNTDCAPDLSCIAEKCRNPCEGSCGFNSDCRVQNHIPICTCRAGYSGDPFTQCTEYKETSKVHPTSDPCDPSPCGSNTNCDNGVCECIKNYFGDPYTGCRPECTMNTDCSPNKACLNNRCVDPCVNTCGLNANCDVVNHIPACTCPPKHTGDPFSHCREIPKEGKLK